MVVDRKGKMVTARKFPHMSTVVPMVTKEHLVLTYPGMEEIKVEIPRRESKVESTWQKVGKVAKLYIYPIKSLANVQVEKFDVKANGAEDNWTIDKQFMVVDRKGKMVTARKFPHMSTVVP